MEMSKSSYWKNAYALASSRKDILEKLRIDQFLGSNSCDIEHAQINDFSLPLEIISTVKGTQDNSFEELNYSITPFYWTNILLASTTKGICFIGFMDTPKSYNLESEIRKNYPKSKLAQKKDKFQTNLLEGLEGKPCDTISLHICGTEFQNKVWQELVKLKSEELVTYKDLADRLGKAKAYRAIGTAVGQNPISLLIPCHQVVGSDHKLAGYRWGLLTKLTLLIGEKGIHE